MKKLVSFAIVGVLIGIPLYALAQTGDPTLDWIIKVVPVKYLGILAAVWGVLFYVVGPIVKAKVKGTSTTARLAVRAAEWITQDTHRPPTAKQLEAAREPPVPPPAPPAGGFATFWILPIVAVLFMLFAWVARADDAPKADRRFGGCTGTTKYLGIVCVGPTTSFAVAKLSGGVITQTRDIAVGYGPTIFSDKWYAVGLSGNAVQSPEATTAAIFGSFGEYVRFGRVFGPSPHWGLGLGLDFGPTFTK